MEWDPPLSLSTFQKETHLPTSGKCAVIAKIRVFSHSERVALLAVLNADHLAESHSPHVEQGPGHCKQWQSKHCQNTQVKTLILLLDPGCKGRCRHRSSRQTCGYDSTLSLLHLTSRNCLWAWKESIAQLSNKACHSSQQQERGKARSSHCFCWAGLLSSCGLTSAWAKNVHIITPCNLWEAMIQCDIGAYIWYNQQAGLQYTTINDIQSGHAKDSMMNYTNFDVPKNQKNI